jgi:hypothetical protein
MHTRESLRDLPRVTRQRASLEVACGPLVTPERGGQRREPFLLSSRSEE